MDGVQLSQGDRATTRRQFTLYLPSLFISCPGLNNATKEISNNSKTHDLIMTFSKNN